MSDIISDRDIFLFMCLFSPKENMTIKFFFTIIYKLKEYNFCY